MGGKNYHVIGSLKIILYVLNIHIEPLDFWYSKIAREEKKLGSSEYYRGEIYDWGHHLRS